MKEVPSFTLPFEENEEYNQEPDWKEKNAEREQAFKQITDSELYRTLKLSG